MRLYVITRPDEIVPVEVNPKDSILRVQALVMERQCLIYNSTPLDIHRTVGSYGLQGNSTLHLTRRRQDRFTLYIRTFSNWTFMINATRNDTLAAIKHQIRNKEPLYTYDQQVLFYNGILMQGDNRALSTFNIVGDALMDLGLTNTPIAPIVPPTTTPVAAPTTAPVAAPTTGTDRIVMPTLEQMQTQQPLQTPVPIPTNNDNTNSNPNAHTPQSKSNDKGAIAHSMEGANQTQHTTSPSRKRSYPPSSSTQPPAKMATPENLSTLSTIPPPAKVATVTKIKIPPPKVAAPVPGVNVLVQIQCHTKQIDIAINTTDKVSVLKGKIFKHTNIATTAQSLTHNGKRMDDDEAVGTYGVQSGAKIDMLARPPRTSRIRKPLNPADTPTPSTPSKSTSTSMDLLPIKSECTEDSHKEVLNTLYKWKSGDNGIIDLLSSDEEEEKAENRDETAYTKQVPSQQQQQEQKKKRTVKVRVQDGMIYTLEMNHSPDSTLWDVIQQYQRMTGQGNKQLSRKSIIFGGVIMEHEFLLDDLYLEEDSILNLV